MVESINTQVAYATPKEQASDNPEKTEEDKEFSFFGDDGFTFWDFVDMINPFQQIPIVSTAYRAITGDEIDPGSRLVGGTLYGGPIGLAASTFNVVVEHQTGKDVGEHVLALFEGDEAPVDDKTMVAQNQSSFSNPNVAGFAPLNVPQTEADAFAAGEASLRLAELQEFMNPSLAKEVPVQALQTQDKGNGSLGTWAPPANVTPPFQTENPNQVQPSPSATSVQPATQQPGVTEPVVTMSPQYKGFQAQHSHEENLDALRAFARDIKAQRLQDQAQKQPISHQPQTAPVAPAPLPARTSNLSQTQDNGWFADMMSQNMDRYQQSEIKG